MTDPLYKKPRRWPKRLGYSLITLFGFFFIVSLIGERVVDEAGSEFEKPIAERTEKYISKPIDRSEAGFQRRMAERQKVWDARDAAKRKEQMTEWITSNVRTASTGNLGTTELKEIVDYSLTKGMQVGAVVLALEMSGDTPSQVCYAMNQQTRAYIRSMYSVDSTTRSDVKSYIKKFQNDMSRRYRLDACTWD